MTITLMQGDCLSLMWKVPSGSVDAIICDLPYGTTACSWDVVIPFEPLWAHYKRIIKKNGAIVLLANEPFTSLLVCSNLEGFRYRWTWNKVNRKTGFLDANRRPLRMVEDVCVFYESQPTYNPQMEDGKSYDSSSGKRTTENYGSFERVRTICDGKRYPLDLLNIEADRRGTEGRVHPTQKPVELFEYFIRTYTNEGETVMDNCFGSGTTGIACVRTQRNFIGIEKEPIYFEIARKRIEAEQADIESTLFYQAEKQQPPKVVQPTLFAG